MNTQKLLSDELDDILKSKQSRVAKKIAIVKLGIREKEANFLLKMRGTLSKGGSSKFNASGLTFGVEIECFNVSRSNLIAEAQQRRVSIQSQGYNHETSIEHYKIVSDGSIEGQAGEEIVSPILKGKKGLDSLKNVCDSLCAIDARVNRSTGLHIHFDVSKTSDKHFVRIFTNYQRLEGVIDSFMARSRRARNNVYCNSITQQNLSGCETKSDVLRVLGSRYYKVNAQSYLRYKTVEFRQHAGTTDYTKIYNWINFLRKLIQFSFDSDIETVNTIDEIPFLNSTEKSYFNDRANQLNS